MEEITDYVLGLSEWPIILQGMYYDEDFTTAYAVTEDDAIIAPNSISDLGRISFDNSEHLADVSRIAELTKDFRPFALNVPVLEQARNSYALATVEKSLSYLSENNDNYEECYDEYDDECVLYFINKGR